MNTQNLLRITVAAAGFAWATTSGYATKTADASPTASAKPSAQPDSRTAALCDVIQTYQTALNAKNVNAVLALYSSDPIFIPEFSPAVVGLDGVRAAYQSVFATIDFDIRFEIHELQQAGDWAWVRTTSAGTTVILASGAEVPEGNNELFVLHREHGAWKIHRYQFATNLPRT